MALAVHVCSLCVDTTISMLHSEDIELGQTWTPKIYPLNDAVRDLPENSNHKSIELPQASMTAINKDI